MKPIKKFQGRYVEYPASDLTKRTAEILSEAQHGRLPVIISKHDKPIAFLAPISLLEKLEAGLLENLEEEGTRIETVTREIRRSARGGGRVDVSTDHAGVDPDEKAHAPASSGPPPEDRSVGGKTMTVAVPRKARR